MKTTIKQILAAIMLSIDVIFTFYGVADGISTGDGISWFLAVLFGACGYMAFDYLSLLSKQKKEEEKQMRQQERTTAKQRQKELDADREMAEEIRRRTEVTDLSPEELSELLSGNSQSMFENEEKHAGR